MFQHESARAEYALQPIPPQILSRMAHGESSKTKHAHSTAVGTINAPSPPVYRAAGSKIQHMPVEMALLARCGLSLDLLFDASEAAAVQGVSLDEYVLAEGLISASRFYRGLAAHLRLPFVAHPVKFAHRQAPRLQIATGVALVADDATPFRYLTAPRGHTLRALLQNRNRDLTNVAITTPALFRANVLDQARSHLRDESSLGLWRKDNDLSAFSGVSPAQFIVLGLCVFLGSFFGALNPRAAFEVLGLICGALSLAFVLLRLAAIWVSPTPQEQASEFSPLPDFALPRYTLVLALYKEVAVVQKLHAALANIDYPRAKLDIILVLEEEDTETQAALAKMGMSEQFTVLIAPNGLPRTKPRALNVALPFVRGELVCVYDAEDVPDRDQLRKAAARFACASPDLACLQAQLVIENRHDSLLARLFAIEYAALFDVINPGMAELSMPFPLGGTSNHFRTAALRQIGGWDAWNVTEDADLSFRLTRHGFQIGMIRSNTYEEAPIKLSAWLGQRRRWLKGWMQTLIVHSRKPWTLVADVGALKAAVLHLMLFGTVLTTLIAPFVFSFVAKLALSNHIVELDTRFGAAGLCFSGLVCGLGLVSALWAAALGLVRRGWLSALPWLVLLPFYYVLVSAAAWLALYELIVRPYFWSKTEHGRQRNDRHNRPFTSPQLL